MAICPACKFIFHLLTISFKKLILSSGNTLFPAKLLNMSCIILKSGSFGNSGTTTESINSSALKFSIISISSHALEAFIASITSSRLVTPFSSNSWYVCVTLALISNDKCRYNMCKKRFHCGVSPSFNNPVNTFNIASLPKDAIPPPSICLNNWYECVSSCPIVGLAIFLILFASPAPNSFSIIDFGSISSIVNLFLGNTGVLPM